MKNENKNPIWITIPDKSNSDNIVLPKNPKKKVSLSGALDKVNNKFLWGAGFVALAIFSFMLIMPGKFSELVQGDLFDGQFQVIPDDTNQADNPFFGGTNNPDNTEEQSTEDSTNTEVQTQATPGNNSSQNNSDAVPVQINPVETENSTTVEESEVVLQEETENTESQNEPNAELQALLESLSAQLEQLKQDGLKKDQQIQALTEMLEQQAIHNAAKPQETETNTEKPSNQTPPQNTSQNQNGGVYKNNTHTVQLNPHDVLAQNQKPQTQVQSQQQVSQADLTQNLGAQNMNTSLSGVNSQPTTGPMETLMIAFLLSCFTILGFGIYQNIKAR